MPYSLTLQGLSQATGTDPDATDYNTLKARSDQRTAVNNQAQDAFDESPMNPNSAQDSYFASVDRANGPANAGDAWSPFYEALSEAPERTTGNPNARLRIGGATGLSTDTGLGPVQMSPVTMNPVTMNPVDMTHSTMQGLLGAIGGRKQKQLGA